MFQAAEGRSRRAGHFAIWLVSVLMWGGLTEPVAAQGVGDVFRALGRALGAGGTKPAGEDAKVRPTGQSDPTQPAVELELAGEVKNEFTPVLQQVLEVELYFANKICQLNEDQQRELQGFGKLQLSRMSAQFADAQKRNLTTAEWPDVRQEFTRALAGKLEEMLSTEQANTYRAEVAARETARQLAARDLMIAKLGRKFALSPDQIAQLEEQLLTHWRDAWARNLMVYNYDEFSPYPPLEVLREVLTAEQLEILESGRQNFGIVSFGWQGDLFLTPLETHYGMGKLQLYLPLPERGQP